MAHEPDWESLGSIQFLLHQRIAEQLNTALSAISLIDAPEAGDVPPGFWQNRAGDAVLRALNLENAWSSLIRHKLGEHFLPQHMGHFHASEIIRWLAVEIGCPHYATPGDDTLLIGNRETLQEALLLLHSCAGTLGPHVRLVVGIAEAGLWFRMRFDVMRATAPTLGLLHEALARAGNWRADTARFELQRAEDFLNMNGCALHYHVTAEHGELAFCVPTAHPSASHRATALTAGDDTEDTVRPGAHDAQSTPVVVAPAQRPASVG